MGNYKTMKTLLVVNLLMVPFFVMGQSPVNKVIPVKNGQSISMNFDYPDLIKITTWDKGEISVEGTVEINFGEDDDAFELTSSESGNTIYLESKIRDLKNLPQRMMIVKNGEKIYFASKSEFNKYKNDHPGGYDIVSWSRDMNIVLEIKVPKNTTTSVTSVYGVVEVRNFDGPLSVDARYGAVDAAINEKTVGELSAETNFGQIYSNLEVKFDADGFSDKNFYTFVKAKPGSGPVYDFESKYGNVYLRKSSQ